MAYVTNGDLKLHVDVDGHGDPVTVFAHGLTNSCRELALLAPMLGGTNVRFCFRGHGHSDAPESGYRFADFASDLDAVAREYGATRAVGTSLGAGAICSLLADEPDRFERLVFLLPAGVDVIMEDGERFSATADILESYPKDEAIAKIMGQPDVLERYTEMPWMAEMAQAIWEDVDPKATAQAIREVIRDTPVTDRDLLRAVQTPALIICRANDPVHPVIVGEILADVMPNADLRVFSTDDELFGAIPALIAEAREFLS